VLRARSRRPAACSASRRPASRNPSFEEWWGKPAPDFTLTDIEGKTHKLSDYRGKEVLVEIWATWVPTCKLEIPHLKELRGAFDQNTLAILAISNETPAQLKTFATEQGLNYTVLSRSADLPAPFGKAEFGPTSFFIDREGRFKVAGVGVVPAADAKAVVQAK
jgi:peroxiredoxin